MTPDSTPAERALALQVRQANCAHSFIPMGRLPERCVHCGVDDDGTLMRSSKSAAVVRGLTPPPKLRYGPPDEYWTPARELKYAIDALTEARDSRGLMVMLCSSPRDIGCVARELTRMLSIVMEDDLVEHSFTKRYDTSHWFRHLALLANLYAAHLKARHE